MPGPTFIVSDLNILLDKSIPPFHRRGQFKGDRQKRPHHPELISTPSHSASQTQRSTRDPYFHCIDIQLGKE